MLDILKSTTANNIIYEVCSTADDGVPLALRSPSSATMVLSPLIHHLYTMINQKCL
ncbi:MAG: hypothetical protein MET45_01950 [Nostoc sp. LLA-1]|nr:hypothetical protein [Cyanocohniella sp. LLY]